jgi:hypothetical protein
LHIHHLIAQKKRGEDACRPEGISLAVIIVVLAKSRENDVPRFVLIFSAMRGFVALTFYDVIIISN